MSKLCLFLRVCEIMWILAPVVNQKGRSGGLTKGQPSLEKVLVADPAKYLLLAVLPKLSFLAVGEWERVEE